MWRERAPLAGLLCGNRFDGKMFFALRGVNQFFSYCNGCILPVNRGYHFPGNRRNAGFQPERASNSSSKLCKATSANGVRPAF